MSALQRHRVWPLIIISCNHYKWADICTKSIICIFPGCLVSRGFIFFFLSSLYRSFLPPFLCHRSLFTLIYVSPKASRVEHISYVLLVFPEIRSSFESLSWDNGVLFSWDKEIIFWQSQQKWALLSWDNELHLSFITTKHSHLLTWSLMSGPSAVPGSNWLKLCMSDRGLPIINGQNS